MVPVPATFHHSPAASNIFDNPAIRDDKTLKKNNTSIKDLINPSYGILHVVSLKVTLKCSQMQVL